MDACMNVVIADMLKATKDKNYSEEDRYKIDSMIYVAYKIMSFEGKIKHELFNDLYKKFIKILEKY